MMDEKGYLGLSEESWRILQEVIETGQITLKEGGVRKATTTEVLMTARYIANLKPPRVHRVDLPEWTPPVTRLAEKDSG